MLMTPRLPLLLAVAFLLAAGRAAEDGGPGAGEAAARGGGGDPGANDQPRQLVPPSEAGYGNPQHPCAAAVAAAAAATHAFQECGVGEGRTENGRACADAAAAYKAVVTCVDANDVADVATDGGRGDGGHPRGCDDGASPGCSGSDGGARAFGQQWRRGDSSAAGRGLADHLLEAVTLAHYRLGELSYRHAGNMEAALDHLRRGVALDHERVRRNHTRLGNLTAVRTLRAIGSAFERRVREALDLAYSLESAVNGGGFSWNDLQAVYWVSLLVTVIPFLLTTYIVTHYGDDFGRLASAFKDKVLEAQFWREEDMNSLQRSNFFVAVSIPIIVPHVFLFGGPLSTVSAVQGALVLFYTGSNSPARLWKWASRLETALFCVVTPVALRNGALGYWSDLSGRVLLLPVLRMFWGCMVTVSIEELTIQCALNCIVAIVMTMNSPTMEIQLDRAIMVTLVMFLVFFLCNILYYERRRNFLILKDLRNKNNVIDHLEQNGNVVSFTVEVRRDFTTCIVGVSNSCQRLYGYYPSEMIGKKDEAFIAQEDIPLIKLDMDRARKKLLPHGWGPGPSSGSHGGGGGDGGGGGGGGDDRDGSGSAKVTRHLRYCRVLASGEKAWVFGVGFYTWKAGRLMLFYQEHLIQDEMEENEKLLKEAEGDIEEEYDSYVADLNQKVEVAMARSYGMAEAYSSAWQ